MEMLDAVVRNLNVKRRGTYEALIELWQEAARKNRFDLTGWLVELEVEGLTTFTVAKGLVVTVAEGKVLVQLSPEETSALAVGEYHYVLWISKTIGGKPVKLNPVVGTFAVENP